MSSTLFIGDGQYIASVNASLTFNATAQTLPADFNIKSMEIYGDRLFIAADNGQYTRVFVWDGASTFFSSYFDIKDESVAPYLIFNNGVLWAVSCRGGTTPGSPIYTFNGNSFQKLMSLPIKLTAGVSSLATYKGTLLIPSNDTSGSYEDGVAGVWMIARYDDSYPYSANLILNPSNGVTNTTIGGIYSSGQTIYVATDNTSSGHNYQVWEIQNSTNAAGIWQSLPIDAGDASRKKAWHSIQIDCELDNDADANRTITVKYRTNYQNSFVTLKTLTTTTDSRIFVPIGATSPTIDIRIEVNTAGGATNSTKVHGFVLNYSLGEQ